MRIITLSDVHEYGVLLLSVLDTIKNLVKQIKEAKKIN